jgi:MHS family proline/betaine transporter-like MFS transporter
MIAKIQITSSMPPTHYNTANAANTDIAPKPTSVLWAVVVGNGLIAYDFTVYSFSAVTIGLLFFPFGSKFVSLLLSFATFGAGFVMRPLGALVIGYLADAKGRKTALTLASVLMALGMGIVALVPTYATIGPAATVLIVVARLLQGFVFGGEVGVSSAVLMESQQQGRCFRTSWRGASQGAAALLGALVSAGTVAALTPQELRQWGWRLPFILGMLIAPVGWYLRHHMHESPKEEKSRPSLRQMFDRHRRQLFCGVLMMAAPSASIYIMVYYMPTYLVGVLHFPQVISLLIACAAGVVIFVGTPLMAKLADRLAEGDGKGGGKRGDKKHGDLKPIQAALLICSIVSIYPAFLALTHGVGQRGSLLIITGYAVVSLTSAGISSVMYMLSFPRHHRAAGMSIIESAGITLFGGFSPFIVTWLMGATGMRMVPAWYLLAASSLSLLGLILFPAAMSDERALH